jgi:hypothetical protein
MPIRRKRARDPHDDRQINRPVRGAGKNAPKKPVWIWRDPASSKARLLDGRSQEGADMDELNTQTCQLDAAQAGERSLPDMKAPDMADLYEPAVGIVSMSRICAYFLRRENPDMDELRKVVAMLVTSSETVLGMIRNDTTDPL